LGKGWNSVSLLVQPKDSSMAKVLASVLPEIVVVKNDAGKIFSPRYEIDAIKSWKTSEAYLIYCEASSTLSVNGEAISPELQPVQLDKGWNLVPYFRSGAMPVNEALGSVASNVILVKDTAGRVYYPALGIDDIGELQPGQGYYILATEETTLVYPPNPDQRSSTLKAHQITSKDKPAINKRG